MVSIILGLAPTGSSADGGVDDLVGVDFGPDVTAGSIDGAAELGRTVKAVNGGWSGVLVVAFYSSKVSLIGVREDLGDTNIPLEPLMTTRNCWRVCPLLVAVAALICVPHKVHLMLIVDGGFGQAGAGSKVGSRS